MGLALAAAAFPVGCLIFWMAYSLGHQQGRLHAWRQMHGQLGGEP